MRVLWICAIALATALAAGDPARADTITYTFTGSVYDISVSAGNTASGVYAVGDAVSGSFTIDDSGATDSAAAADLGIYNGTTSYTLNIGSGTWTGTWSARVLNDNVSRDGFAFVGAVGGVTGTTHGSYVPAVTGMDDVSNDLSIWASDGLGELFNLDYNDWPSIAGGIRFDDTTLGSGTWEFVGFQLDSLTAVPEPTSLTLVGLCALGLACGIRRRARRTKRA
jgi:hypothetical protein